MMKRIIALLLALILTVGLLPTVALAAEGNPPTTDSGSVTKEASKDNLNLVKTVTKEGDNYKVTLESWATGTVTSSSTPVPMDIILLLDQSSSMDDWFTSSSKTEYNRLNRTNGKIYRDFRDKLYVYEKSEYVKVNVKREIIVLDKNKYTYTWNGGSFVSYGNNDYPAKTFYYQTTNTSSQKKIDALKTAVNKFVTKVSEEATSKKVDHRVAIVGFASKNSGKYYENTELLSTQSEVNYANASADNYKNALVSAKTNKNRLDTAINRLDASGDTYPEYGFDMANQIFAQYPIQAGENRQRVVIMFTDGYPAPANTDNFNVGMANNAINNAKRCKDNNAKVYTIGIFDGADPSASIENYSQNGRLNEAVAANRYMHFSSSNYPSAMALNNGGTKGEGNFYFAASNADALNDIFDTISEEISTDTTELDDSATIIDNIPGNFTIPAEAQGIKVYTAKCAGKTGETLTWAERASSPLQASSATVNGKTSVSVTGFNYSDEWCGLDENNKPHGSKLIIEFTIAHNNYGGTQPTNAGASIKDEEGKEVIKVDDPTVPVTISKPDDVFTQANEKTYNGSGFDILSEVATKANTLADGTNNAFVDIEVKITVEGTDYIYTISKGQQSGTWNQTASPKTSPNVKDEDKNGTPEAYEYPVTITFKDAAEGSNALNSTTATAKFKIKYAEATVKANNKSKKATEPDPDFDATVEGMVNGEKAEEKLTYDIARTDAGNNTVGDHPTIKPDGSTYQNNYKVTYETGTLTITADSTEKVLTIKGHQSEVTYDGDSHTVSGYDVTYPTGTSEADFTITLKNGKTGIVTETNVKTDGDGKYMMGLIAGDFNVESSKYSNVKVSYTEDGYLKINPRPITLKSGDASKTYDGAALTKKEVTVTSGNFVSGEGLDYNVTGSRTEVGTSENTYTYTAKAGTTLTNYTITEEKGDLTVTLPDLTARPNVIVNCVNTEVPAHTEKNTSLTNADHYTVSTEATKVDGQNAYTRTITLTEAGKNHFISSEYVSEYGSHTPATNGNVTEITMTYSEVNGEWAWRASHTNFRLNVECTTPTVEVDLGNYIKKTLTGTNFHENFEATFTVEVTYTDDNDSGTATGSVRFTGADTKDFGFVSTVELKKNHVYKFTATERADNVPGVDYDTRTYSFALKITAEGDVVFGSVVEGVFVADETDNKYVTITNTYTEPKEPRVVSKTVVTTDMVDTLPPSVSSDIEAFKNKVDILYPVVNGEASTLEVPYGTKSVTLLYKITVNAGTKTSMQFEDVGAERVSVFDDDNVDVSQVGRTFTVRFYRGVTTADIYVAKTYKNLVFDSNGECTVENVISEEIKATTTVTEKDPNKLTINFADFVKKELTATGTKTASDVDFTVDVKGKEQTTIIASAEGEEAISTYADEFDPKYSRTLTAHFDSITGGEVKTARFTGTTVEIDHAGYYTFFLGEEKGTRTGVTYDETRYTLYINVRLDQNENKLYVSSMGAIRTNADGTWENIALIEMVNDEPVRTTNYITFHNTIDTGKDDYYPIIIPTIINKDTGMLNKTDHFAYVIGYPDGTVHPNGQITRAEVATIFFRLLRDEVRDGAFTTSNSYSDVAYGKWYNNPISTMSALGIITGYPDGTFKPNKPITRAEFAAIAARFDETQSGKSATFSDVIGHWAAKEIGIAYYNDWIKGYPDGTFKPDQNITRAEAMTLINRVLERKPESPADLLTNMNKWTDNMDTSKWYYLDVQEATNSHGYTRKTFNYELWRQMLPDPDWSRYER